MVAVLPVGTRIVPWLFRLTLAEMVSLLSVRLVWLVSVVPGVAASMVTVPERASCVLEAVSVSGLSSKRVWLPCKSTAPLPLSWVEVPKRVVPPSICKAVPLATSRVPLRVSKVLLVLVNLRLPLPTWTKPWLSMRALAMAEPLSRRMTPVLALTRVPLVTFRTCEGP